MFCISKLFRNVSAAIVMWTRDILKCIMSDSNNRISIPLYSYLLRLHDYAHSHADSNTKKRKNTHHVLQAVQKTSLGSAMEEIYRVNRLFTSLRNMQLSVEFTEVYRTWSHGPKIRLNTRRNLPEYTHGDDHF